MSSDGDEPLPVPLFSETNNTFFTLTQHMGNQITDGLTFYPYLRADNDKILPRSVVATAAICEESAGSGVSKSEGA